MREKDGLHMILMVRERLLRRKTRWEHRKDGTSAGYWRRLGLFMTPWFVSSAEVAKHVYICGLDPPTPPSVTRENICPR